MRPGRCSRLAWGTVVFHLLERSQQGTARTALIAEQALLYVDGDRQCPMQRLQACSREFDVFGADIGPAPHPCDHGLALQGFQHERHLHRVDVAKPGQLPLRHGIAGPAEPGCQGQRRELQVRDVEWCESPVDLAYVPMNDTP